MSQSATTARTVHLQGIGRRPAVEASELAVGDTLMWNEGMTTTVTAISNVSPVFLLVTQRSRTSGQEHERRMRKTRLVVRVDAPATAADAQTQSEDQEADAHRQVAESPLQLGDLVEYDARTVEFPDGPKSVPGGRGRVRDVWASQGQAVARVEREDGTFDAPPLEDLRPVTRLTLTPPAV